MANITEKQLRDTFDLFDADDSGKVDADELGLLLEALGFGKLPPDELDDIISRERDIAGSTDDTSVLDYDQFKRLVRSMAAHKDSAEEVVKAFRCFDKDQKGTITVDDFCAIAEAIAEEVKPDVYRDVIREACGPNADGLDIDKWRMIHREITTVKRKRYTPDIY
ncbi:Caltractin [Diplonema papillatum]|nr:Caltractin [Diplonema papillatum]|eukprot:gene18039-27784_t